MEIPTRNNTYAQLLEKQSCYVINVDGVDWYHYSGFMMPAYLPHCVPAISEEIARKARGVRQAFCKMGCSIRPNSEQRMVVYSQEGLVVD